MKIIKDHNYEELVSVLNSYMAKEYVDFIDRYHEQAKLVYEGMKRKTGEDYIFHPINVAYILAELKMDPVTIGCALIHEALTLEKMTYEQVEEMFGIDSQLTLAYREAKLVGAQEVYLCNCYKFTDYIEVLDLIFILL